MPFHLVLTALVAFDVDITLELIIKKEKIDKIKSFLKELFSGDIDYKNEINIEFYYYMI